jgi:glutaredoxin
MVATVAIELRRTRMAQVKLHRCSLTWFKLDAHPCWRVQKALDESGVEYEVVKAPLPRGRREEVKRLSGQAALPVIEFEDGTAYREQSKEMAARIREGKLFEGRDSAQADGAPTPPEAQPPPQ